jgi:RNA polymerase-binding transcription factor DksA
MPDSKKGKSIEPEDFRKALVALRDRLSGDLDRLTDEALQANGNDGGGHSKVPIHLADLGTETFDQDLALGVIENEQATLDEVDAALSRIKDGRFGACEACEQPIAKLRLQALPYARYCIECAREAESRVKG